MDLRDYMVQSLIIQSPHKLLYSFSILIVVVLSSFPWLVCNTDTHNLNAERFNLVQGSEDSAHGQQFAKAKLHRLGWQESRAREQHQRGRGKCPIQTTRLCLMTHPDIPGSMRHQFWVDSKANRVDVSL